jgi:hypothetical protein
VGASLTSPTDRRCAAQTMMKNAVKSTLHHERKNRLKPMTTRVTKRTGAVVLAALCVSCATARVATRAACAPAVARNRTFMFRPRGCLKGAKF